ncbi:MAG: C4-dicarboxylate ABC transporter [Bacillota bacterium]
MINTILILLIFLILAILMFTKKLPTMLALPILAVGIAVIAGIPITGEESVLQLVLHEGATRMSSAYAAVIFGAWLGQILTQTGISQSIVRFAAELGGDRPMVVTFLLAAAVAVLFTTISGLGAVIMVGSIVLPILLSFGLPPLAVGGTFLLSFGIGITINIANWQFYVDATGVSLQLVRNFALTLAGFTALATTAFILIQFKKEGRSKYWAKPKFSNNNGNDKKVTKLSILTPVVPLVMVLVFDWPIIPAFIMGIIYSMIALRKPIGKSIDIITKSCYEGISDVAPVIILMMGIGMLINVVFHPTVSQQLEPFLSAVIPSSTIGYIAFFSLLAPLALYRGPLNMWGLGSGIVGLVISLELLPAPAAMAAFLSTERVQAIGDPTNTHNVWVANYIDSDVNQILRAVIPYIWSLAAAGVITATFFYM